MAFINFCEYPQRQNLFYNNQLKGRLRTRLKFHRKTFAIAQDAFLLLRKLSVFFSTSDIGNICLSFYLQFIVIHSQIKNCDKRVCYRCVLLNIMLAISKQMQAVFLCDKSSQMCTAILCCMTFIITFY